MYIKYSMSNCFYCDSKVFKQGLCKKHFDEKMSLRKNYENLMPKRIVNRLSLQGMKELKSKSRRYLWKKNLQSY